MSTFFPGRILKIAHRYAAQVVKEATKDFTPDQADETRNSLPDQVTDVTSTFLRTMKNFKKYGFENESIQLKPLIKEGKKLIVEGDYADLDKAFNNLYKILEKMYGKNLSTTQYNKIIKSLDNVQRYINEAEV